MYEYISGRCFNKYGTHAKIEDHVAGCSELEVGEGSYTHS